MTTAPDSTSRITPPTPATSPISRPRATPRLSVVPEPVDRAPWSEVGPEFIRAWGYPKGKFQPEHLELLGPTGTGKSFFLRTILLQRAAVRQSHIVLIVTKRADDTIAELNTEWEWPIIDHWPPDYGKHQVIFWTKAGGISRANTARQKEEIAKLLDQLWQPDANIVVAFDEIFYVQRVLGLEPEIITYMREGRTLGITVVAMTQRGPGLTRYVHSESSWSGAFAPKDDEDAERVAQILGNKRLYQPILATLDRSKHEVLLVHNVTGQKVITWIDPASVPKPPRR